MLFYNLHIIVKYGTSTNTAEYLERKRFVVRRQAHGRRSRVTVKWDMS
jgi:hypothetical protein